jgi:Pretoxin HINT domain
VEHDYTPEERAEAIVAMSRSVTLDRPFHDQYQNWLLNNGHYEAASNNLFKTMAATVNDGAGVIMGFYSTVGPWARAAALGNTVLNISSGKITPDLLLNLIPIVGKQLRQVAGRAVMYFKDPNGTIRVLTRQAVCRIVFLGYRCFTGDTLVQMADGSKRRIDSVAAGERVRSLNQETGQWESSIVRDVMQSVHTGRMIRVQTASGAVIESTPEHPYWVYAGADLFQRPAPTLEADELATRPPFGGCWVDAGDLQAGDTLYTERGPLQVVKVEAYQATALPVYNLSIDDYHNYCVGDDAVWVHNASCSKNARELRKNLKANGQQPQSGDQAAHIVPAGDWSQTKRSTAVKLAIAEAQELVNKIMGPGGLNSHINGFFAKAGHKGTHTDKFFRALPGALAGAKDPRTLKNKLDTLLVRIENGEFIK